TWKSTHDLNPYKPIATSQKPLKIQVVALQWKWLFIYPEQGIATLNFVQFPEKTPVSFEITADAPMNSFWIPQLGGQIYAMPAMVSQLNLIADEQGSFRGVSANLSGDGFAGMTFVAKASSETEFHQWVNSVRRSGNFLNLKEYNRLVKPSAYCPEAFYLLKEDNLFDHILMKYKAPAK
ncbi:MAG: cytochrome ubiquinol oxidase subunit II, partial [Chlamydiae bacterium]|nr:cytochrome ubiquinol oxidase subunit II [Chlamydiota bacterium]